MQKNYAQSDTMKITPVLSSAYFCDFFTPLLLLEGQVLWPFHSMRRQKAVCVQVFQQPVNTVQNSPKASNQYFINHSQRYLRHRKIHIAEGQRCRTCQRQTWGNTFGKLYQLSLRDIIRTFSSHLQMRFPFKYEKTQRWRDLFEPDEIDGNYY